MSDITLMRGYGFPKGSQMDYSGYRGFGGLLVANRPARRLSAHSKVPFVPEPSIFEKIPALDGFGEQPHFGTEYQYGDDDLSPDIGPEYRPAELNPMGPEYRPDLLGGGMSTGLKIGLGVLAIALLYR